LPVWHASVSFHDLYPKWQWNSATRKKKGVRILRRALHMVGDPGKERVEYGDLAAHLWRLASPEELWMASNVTKNMAKREKYGSIG
jgi:hypothetical protein